MKCQAQLKLNSLGSNENIILEVTPQRKSSQREVQSASKPV